MGNADLHGRYFFHRCADRMPTDLHGSGTGKNQSPDGMPEKTGTLDSVDFCSAVFADKVFGVFIAEPVSDIIAASVTATMLFTRLNRILEEGSGKRNA